MFARSKILRRSIALSATVSQLALVACSTPPPAPPPIAYDPPPPMTSHTSGSPSRMEVLNELMAGKDSSGIRAPNYTGQGDTVKFSEVRGLYKGELRCGNGSIVKAFDLLLLGDSPARMQGIIALYDPTTDDPSSFIFYEFHGNYDRSKFGLFPVQFLAGNGRIEPEMFEGFFDVHGIGGQFGNGRECGQHFLTRSPEISPAQAAYLQNHYGSMLTTFAEPPATQQQKARVMSSASAPSRLPPSYEGLYESQPLPPIPPSYQPQTPSRSRATPEPYFTPPAEQSSSSSWYPPWLTQENVEKYGGGILIGLATLAAVAALSSGGSSSSPDDSPSVSPPSADNSWTERQREEEREQEEEAGNQPGFYVAPIDPFYSKCHNPTGC